MSKIKAAAIQCDGVIMTGHSHDLIMMNLAREGKRVSDCQKGFVDDQGNFLTRKEAMNVAKDGGQVETIYQQDKLLYSYMLKPNA